MKTGTSFALALLLTAASATAAAAQVSVTPMIGGYIPASDFQTLKGGAEEVRFEREAAMALGLNVELGALRGSIAYVTGTTLNEDGIGDSSRIGDGSLLAAAADLVLRPIPRIAGLQPYVLGGGGIKRHNYSFEDSGYAATFPENETDLSAHLGAGADFMLGRIGVVAEVTDFVTYKDGDFGQHDVFGTVGVRLRLF